MSLVKLKALSLWQPWATLLVHGEKKIETRSWCPPVSIKFPFTLAVHASKKWTYDLKAVCSDEPFRSTLTNLGYAWYKNHSINLKYLPLGALVGTVEIYDVVQFSGYGSRSEGWEQSKERAFGDFADGRYGWLAAKFNPFKEPIPMCGRQGLFNVEIEEVAPRIGSVD